MAFLNLRPYFNYTLSCLIDISNKLKPKHNLLSHPVILHFSAGFMTTCGLNQISGNKLNPITLPSYCLISSPHKISLILSLLIVPWIQSSGHGLFSPWLIDDLPSSGHCAHPLDALSHLNVTLTMRYVRLLLSISPDNADNVKIGNLKIIKDKKKTCPRSHCYLEKPGLDYSSDCQVYALK